MPGTTLPANSSITIDGVTLQAPAAVIYLWEAAIANAIDAGDVEWVSLPGEGGTTRVLVTPTSRVASFIADDDMPGVPAVTNPHSVTESNLPFWIDRYLERDGREWEIVEILGLDKAVDAYREGLEGSLDESLGDEEGGARGR